MLALSAPLLLATAVFAELSRRQCSSNVPASAMNLPPNQQQLVAPTDAPNFVVVGVGNQNYTCAESGAWTSSGAIAQVFDITSLYPGFEFSIIQEDTYIDWLNFPGNDPCDPNLAQQLENKYGIMLYGRHYIIENPDGDLSSIWDFRPSGLTPGNPNAFVVAEVTGDIPAPTGYLDLDWLELEGVSGQLASTIFRVYTKGGGLLPESCEPGYPGVTAKFTAQYWFYGSTLFVEN
ncbi:hypothetical protein H4582DRAFT_2072465 [Lactarius indigo]|nr:hypothetical protein H4582DRAFT_2072465 [Lactarius indigo]